MQRVAKIIFFVLFPLFSYSNGEFTVYDQLVTLNKYWECNEVNNPILLETKYFKDWEDLIQLHLQLVEEHLRTKEMSHLAFEQQQKRKKGLDILNAYWKGKQFPQNIHHSGQIVPYFIDDFNTACAVGHVLRETGSVTLAERIQQENNYAYLEDMPYDELLTWATEYGFEEEELRWIQPTYSAPCFPQEALPYEEDFEDYSSSLSFSNQTGCWYTWSGQSGSTEEPSISQNQALLSNQSLRIRSGDDIVLTLGDRRTGQYQIKFSIFVPTGRRGYFNTLHQFIPDNTNNEEWAMEVYFNADGNGTTDVPGPNNPSFTYPQDRWITVVQNIDLDNNLASLYIDNIKLGTWGFTSSQFDPSDGDGKLAGINFYSDNSQFDFYIDNVGFYDIDLPNCNGSISNQTWVRDIINNCRECLSLSTANWNNKQIVIEIWDAYSCGYADAGYTKYYDCNGKELGQTGVSFGGVWQAGISIDEISSINIIHECSTCTLDDLSTTLSAAEGDIVSDFCASNPGSFIGPTRVHIKVNGEDLFGVFAGGQARFYNCEKELVCSNGDCPASYFSADIISGVVADIICNDLPNCDNVENSIWLQEYIRNIDCTRRCPEYINLYSYQGREVIDIYVGGGCFPQLDLANHTVYDCLGNFLFGYSTGDEISDYNFIKGVWGCLEFPECSIAKEEISCQQWLQDTLSNLRVDNCPDGFVCLAIPSAYFLETYQYDQGIIEIRRFSCLGGARDFYDCEGNLITSCSSFFDTNEKIVDDCSTDLLNKLTNPVLIGNCGGLFICNLSQLPPTREEILCLEWLSPILQENSNQFCNVTCTGSAGVTLSKFNYLDNEILGLRTTCGDANWTFYDRAGNIFYQCLQFSIINEATCSDEFINSLTDEVVIWKCGDEIKDCNENSNSCVERDKAALIAFYNAMGGDNWKRNNNWLSDKPLSEWYGITTNQDGCVVIIELDGNFDNNTLSTGGNNLVGKLYDLDFPMLERLLLGNNSLSGVIPDFTKMPNLKVIGLHNNDLNGVIPNFSKIPFATELAFNHNNLEKFPDLSQCPELKRIHFNFNRLAGSLPTSIGNLKKLNHLSVSSNQLEGEIPKEIERLTNLKFLYLNDNNLTGTIPDEIGNLTQLERLYLQENQLSGSIPATLGQLSQLSYLRLFDNDLTGAIPQSIGALQNLERLSLHSNNLSGSIPEIITSLPKLERLALSDNNFSGCLPSGLEVLCNFGEKDYGSSGYLNGAGYNFTNNPRLAWQGNIAPWCSNEPQIGAPCNDNNPDTENDQITQNCECKGEKVNPSPWEPQRCTGLQDFQSIHLDRLNDRVSGRIDFMDLEEGDLIGIFYENEDGNLVCQDYVAYPAAGESIFLNICGDNPSTSDKDGFHVGEKIQYKVYKNEQEYEDVFAEYHSLGAFSNGRPNAEGTFVGGFTDSYLKTLVTSIDVGQPTCDNPVLISCNIPLIRATNALFDSSSVNTVCTSDNLIDGPEAYFLLQIEEEQDVKIKISDLSNDLELYVLGPSCNDQNCYAEAENFGNGDEILLLENLAPGDYFVLVDGYIGATSEFNLEVECLDLEDEELPGPTDPNDPDNPIPPDPDCPTVITCSSGTQVLSCTTADPDLSNRVNSYGCNPTHFTGGKEKVFKISSPVRTWIRLSLRPELQNLDLFLLDGLDPQNDCLKYSTERETKWDGFWFLTIPNKTYYISVDGFDEDEGAFDLEVKCVPYEEPACAPNCPPGESSPPIDFTCDDAIDISCNQPIVGTNENGKSQYLSWGSCNGRENSGPEVKYSFNNPVTQKVIFYLRDMDANLNLYLLNSCNPFDCNGQGGTKGIEKEDKQDEAVIKNELPAGEYFIIIDGVKGAVSSFELEIVCAEEAECLEIPLLPQGQGENYISSNLLPKDRNLGSITAKYTETIDIIDKMDNATIYSPSTGSTNFNWNELDGFKVLLKPQIKDTILFEICGTPVDTFAITSIKGRVDGTPNINLVGYPFPEPKIVSETFNNADLNGLDKLLNLAPNADVPLYNFLAPNNTTDFEMRPGVAYGLYSDMDRLFNYRNSVNQTLIETGCAFFKVPFYPSLSRSYAKIDASIHLSNLNSEDEIGFFDANGQILGALKYGKSTNLAVLQGNDRQTTSDEGFELGERILLKVYNSKTKTTLSYLPIWKDNQSNEFEKSIVYQLVGLIPTEETNLTDFEIKLQPNPFQQTTNLQINAPESAPVQLEVFSVTGQSVQTHSTTLTSGVNMLLIDLQHEENGMYYLKIKGPDFQKVVPILKM